MISRRFVYGKYQYDYFLIHEARKTLSLTVNPKSEIIVKCPLGVQQERIEAFLRKKWLWLNKQLSCFRRYSKNLYPREYISGEGFYYLGRQYQLVATRGGIESVSLVHGKIAITTKKSVLDGVHNKHLLDKWLSERRKTIFQERLNVMMEKFEYEELPKIVIREMPKRWGSYSSQAKVILNPRLIHASKDCIDYVITHELCHFKYKNHGKKFFTLLKAKYRNWEIVKEKLECRFG
ncbi:M48 family metallopeptidase [Candidatus Gracilibacteria bacterium]|nr:M48 family metallopeptidase [Candidatus Gracilibacteria bacterium]